MISERHGDWDPPSGHSPLQGPPGTAASAGLDSSSGCMGTPVPGPHVLTPPTPPSPHLSPPSDPHGPAAPLSHGGKEARALTPTHLSRASPALCPEMAFKHGAVRPCCPGTCSSVWRGRRGPGAHLQARDLRLQAAHTQL